MLMQRLLMMRWVLLRYLLRLRPRWHFHADGHIGVPKLVVDQGILHAVGRCPDRSLVVTTSSAPIRFSEPSLFRRRDGASNSRVRGFGRCSSNGGLDLLLLLLTTIGLLLIRNVATNDTEVPKHEVGDEDLLVKRSAGIRQFDMTQSIYRTLNMNGIPSEAVEARRGR